MATLKLLEIMETICIPEHWETVDLIKQTSTLMQSTINSSLVDELLFVRKAQAIIEFCTECKSLLKAFKLDIKPTDCEFEQFLKDRSSLVVTLHLISTKYI